MLRLSKDDVATLAALDIDSILVPSFSDEIIIKKGSMVGMYIPTIGIVLEPHYIAVQRFGDLIKVTTQDMDKTCHGAYSISRRDFVIKPIFENHNFWEEFKQCQKSYKNGDQ